MKATNSISEGVVCAHICHEIPATIACMRARSKLRVEQAKGHGKFCIYIGQGLSASRFTVSEKMTA